MATIAEIVFMRLFARIRLFVVAVKWKNVLFFAFPMQWGFGFSGFGFGWRLAVL
ncbi:hypothetical protein WN982_32820 [Paraburkholderia sp. IMGN_8]|uniref:hypothetical protein n=1 Tax=Paraburkholderia sp. IMGN_8 TaxID=3136564 RepID=UPI003100BA41